MIAALWSNSNYDDDKNTRQNAITEIEENFSEATQKIFNPVDEDDEIDRDNPFFQSMDRGIKKKFGTLVDIENETVEDIVKSEYTVDQG